MTSRNEVTPEQEASVQRLAEPGGALSTADVAAASSQAEPEAPAASEAAAQPDVAQQPEMGRQPEMPSQPESAPQPEVAPQREMAQQPDAATAQARVSEERTALLDDRTTDDFRGRWQETQADFVDDPRSAVAAADALVAEVMQRLASEFAREREGLERQWSAGGEASTEDLRLAFQRYRSFFSRLLSL
jgi:hypothetical protein